MARLIHSKRTIKLRNDYQSALAAYGTAYVCNGEVYVPGICLEPGSVNKTIGGRVCHIYQPKQPQKITMSQQFIEKEIMMKKAKKQKPMTLKAQAEMQAENSRLKDEKAEMQSTIEYWQREAEKEEQRAANEKSKANRLESYLTTIAQEIIEALSELNPMSHDRAAKANNLRLGAGLEVSAPPTGLPESYEQTMRRLGRMEGRLRGLQQTIYRALPTDTMKRFF